MDTFEIKKDLLNYLRKFIGLSVDDIKNYLNYESSSKSINFLLSTKLLYSYQSKTYMKAFIKHEDIKIKTIQLKLNGTPKEAMSLPAINYCKIIEENWNTSALFKYFESTFLFFVFKKEKNNKNVLKNILFWKMPLDDLNGEVKDIWLDTKNKLITGNVIKQIKNNEEIITNFIPESSSKICHLRPHGQKGNDYIKIPTKDKLTGYEYITKYSFWINHEYLNNILNKKQHL